MNKLVLDTHILLWSLITPEKLSQNLKHKISIAQQDSSLIISSISLWEIAMLASKKRINIYEPIDAFLQSITDINGLKVVDISAQVTAQSVLLMDDFHGDPADRIIVATTRINSATLVTKDQKILDWAKLGHIKFLEI